MKFKLNTFFNLIYLPNSEPKKKRLDGNISDTSINPARIPNDTVTTISTLDMTNSIDSKGKSILF